MKKSIFILAVMLLCSTTAFAAKDKETKIKTGWNFGAVPAVSYNSDLGLQYGISADIFNYGDGSTFPNYKHKFNTEISHYTKGMTRLHLFYDSKYLIPSIRVTAAATYMNNPMFSFYGFNGAAEPYHPEWNANKTFFSDDSGLAFYNFQRNMFRFLADFQGEILPHLNWAAGISFWNFDISSTEKKPYVSGLSLYDSYVARGVIKDSEKNGGNRFEMKAGLVYDTRDHEATPDRGIWAEVYLNGSPDLFGDGFKYLKLCAHFRQYLPVIPDNRLTFAYHLGYQGTVAGEAPFYMQSNITTLYLRQILSEGLGSINTVRGTLYNRMIGDSYAWANFELRAKIVSFNFINQSWYLAVNPFFDMGAVLKPYRLEEQSRPYSITSLILSGGKNSYDDLKKEATKLHESAGLGIKLVMNQNFIVGIEAAKPFNKDDNCKIDKDGNLKTGMGMNIGLNYIF